MNERQKDILKILGHGELVTVNQLTEKLGVSSVTIRQDLNILESEGLLKRVHGGAQINDSDNIAHRLGVHYEQKLRIARKALEFIREGDTILIESGSLNAILARELSAFNDLTVITTNLFIARQMQKFTQIKVIVPGGIYQHESESMVGQLAKLGIDQVNFAKAFIGVDGFTHETGFTSRDMLRADISSFIVQKCRLTFVLTDSSKFGHVELTKICDASAIQYVITDKAIGADYEEYFSSIPAQLITV
ncbi:MAG: DeoR/GlpR family DNA-binding transcription regulator [Cyclobacteriaceae bacterium]|nr:DeoR/GlpR family DNA-binding transcription regulator [Cyclobacteriaceae bacterium]